MRGMGDLSPQYSVQFEPDIMPEMAKRSIGQWEPGGELADPLFHLGKILDIFEIEHDLADHVGDGSHFRFFHPARGDGGGAEADSAGLEWGAGLKWNCVLIGGDAGLVQGGLAFFAGQTARADINQHQMIIRTATDETEPIPFHAFG